MKTALLKLSPARFCDVTNACAEGREFATKHKTMSAVWRACPRVDWLCWILNAIDAEADEKAVRLYMVWCARNTPLADGRTTGALLTDPRSVAACDMAERFANGDATRKELEAAWSAAESAARSAAWSAAESAAESAARSAAWSAARSAQAAEFRRVVKNPFVSK